MKQSTAVVLGILTGLILASCSPSFKREVYAPDKKPETSHGSQTLQR